MPHKGRRTMQRMNSQELHLAVPSVHGETVVPEHYPPNTLDLICTRLVEGERLNEICDDADMPRYGEVLRWLNTDPGFKALFIDAQRVKVLLDSDKMQAIADGDDREILWKEEESTDPDTGEVTVNRRYMREDVPSRALRVKTIQWRAARLQNDIFGDRMEVGHNVTGDLLKLLEGAKNKGHVLPGES